MRGWGSRRTQHGSGRPTYGMYADSEVVEVGLSLDANHCYTTTYRIACRTLLHENKEVKTMWETPLYLSAAFTHGSLQWETLGNTARAAMPERVDVRGACHSVAFIYGSLQRETIDNTAGSARPRETVIEKHVCKMIRK